MTRKQKRMLFRILLAVALLAATLLIPAEGWVRTVLMLIPYAVVGWDVLWSAVRNIAHGQVFDENFLMSIASIGAFLTGESVEGVAVILLYQVGELFQSCAVARSRRSIADLMDICPESAYALRDGEIIQLPPDEVEVGEEIVIKPGEKVPLDGIVITGESTLNTAALSGESAPRSIAPGDEIVSGCVNLTGLLHVRTTKPYDQSTVAKIVELVESAAERKAKAEDFITKFARWYTPCVVIGAALLALIPSLITGQWSEWVHRALVFLVISCPCALVISVPLSFFGGIGGASRAGILVKGGSYLEVLSRADTVVFDKTGTLTEGEFSVTEVHPVGVCEKELLRLAAHGEMYSDHPLARSVRRAYGSEPDASIVGDVQEIAGRGIVARVGESLLSVGNSRMMAEAGVDVPEISGSATAVHISRNGEYLGYLLVADSPKADAASAIAALRQIGIRETVMLSGDVHAVAQEIAGKLGVDTVHAELLPGDKVDRVEAMLSQKRRGSLVFVGDGINDAPVLSRSDVGIAMGAMGSDAAIEAADVVLMDDAVAKVPQAIRIARRTLAIVRQNIAFALGVKGLILLLGALGYAGMWAAVFADVGVCVIAILNASRALKIHR